MQESENYEMACYGTSVSITYLCRSVWSDSEVLGSDDGRQLMANPWPC